LELFGPSTNLIVTDRSGIILALYRPVPPGEKVNRPLLTGMLYALPEKKTPVERAAAAAQGAGTGIEQASAGDCPVNRSVETWYDRLLRDREASRIRGELSANLKKALGRAERRVEAVSGDLASAEKADDYRRAGELVLANLKALSRGMEAADLTGYDGGTVTVKLDPRLSPSDNAARYFRKYKKAKAGLALITQRLDDARAEAAVLHAFLAEVAAASDQDELTALKAMLMKKGLTGRRTSGKQRSREETPSPPFRKFDYAGWDILVGKTAAGNDYLTLKLARPDDLWLHAEGMPGSHVLIRNPKAGDVPPDVLIKAAALAAYYSKGRGSTKVPVAYTQAKFVKKPKGAKPGTVTLSRRHTVMAAPGKDV
jgi:predicted ribosome quality control (RQC) complex YloA/Tae2 family protein